MQERTREEFESYSALGFDRYHEVRAFPFGDGVGVAFRDVTDRQRDTQALRDRELSLPGSNILAASADWKWIWPMAFAVNALQNISTFTAFPLTSSTTPTSNGSRAFIRKTENGLRSTFWPPSRALIEDYNAEYRIVRPSDDEIRWIRAVAEIERDIQGRALKLVGAHLDITDQKRAEEAIQESEGRLRAITDALPFLISYLDSNQIFRFINKPYEAWFDRPLSEIVGHDVRDVMGPAMYEASRPYIERALAGESLSYEADFRDRAARFIRKSSMFRIEISRGAPWACTLSSWT